MKAVSDATILEFVPTEPTRKKAAEIVEEFLRAGHEWKFMSSHRRRKGNEGGMARSLARRLGLMPEVTAFKLSNKEGKEYSKGGL